MSHEVRLRLPLAFYAALSSAAAARGVAITALAAMVIHEYLHEHGELASNGVGKVQTKPSLDVSNPWDDDEPLNVGS